MFQKFLRNRKVKVASLCIVLAATFWFFNAMNKNNYNSNIYYPIHLQFDDSEFVRVGDIPSEVEVNVSGTGWNILGVYFGMGIDEYDIDIKRYKNQNYVLGRDLTYYITNHIGHLEVNYIRNDTIWFNLERKQTKKIALRLNTDKLDKRFHLKFEPKIEPSIIEVYGSVSAIDDLDEVFELNVEAILEGKTLNKQLLDVEAQLPENVFSEVSQVEITAIVDEFVLRTFDTSIAVSEKKNVSISGAMEIVKEKSELPLDNLLKFSFEKTGDSSAVQCAFDEKTIRKLKYSPKYFKVEK